MRVRVVQIWGFLMTVMGWICVAVTLAMESWKITQVGGQGGASIIKVAWYWSSLWRSCFRDSTSVTNCYDFPVLWAVDESIQIVRGLMLGSVCLGVLGFVLSLVGMECTYLGGEEKSKYRKIYAGGWCHVISGNGLPVDWLGALSTAGYGIYAQYVAGEFFQPSLEALRFNLGTAIFVGWVGSAFHMLGGFFYLSSACGPLCGGKKRNIAVVVPSRKGSVSTDMNNKTSKPVKTKVSTVSEESSQYAFSEVSGISSRARRSFRRSMRLKRSMRKPTMKSDSMSDLSAISTSPRSASPRSASPRAASYYYTSSSGTESSRSSRSSTPRSSESRSSDSRTASSASTRSRSEVERFTKKTYI